MTHNKMRDKSRELFIRLATGAVFVVIVLAAMLFHPISFALLLVVIATGCMAELWRLVRRPFQKLSGLLYIALCMVFLWYFPVVSAGDVRVAPAFMLVVWANDSFAYLVGITLGRHKMSERLSPKKSWEGFAGGLVGAVVVAAIAGRFWLGVDVWLSMFFGLIVGLAAVGGDLLESHIKREAGVKDSGMVFPGHGGFLDRFDAMLGAVPVAFLFLVITFLAK